MKMNCKQCGNEISVSLEYDVEYCECCECEILFAEMVEEYERQMEYNDR